MESTVHLASEDTDLSSKMSKEVAGQVPAAIGILSCIAVVGAVGNALVLNVYCRKQHDKQSATPFILALAISDSLTCDLLIPYTIAVEVTQWRLPSIWLCKGYYFLNNTAIYFTSLLISVIAFDRYLCICHPFLKVMTLSRVKILLRGLAGGSILMGILATFQITLEVNFEHDVPENVGGQRNVHNFTNVSRLSYQCVEIVKSNSTTVYSSIFYHLVQKSQSFCFLLCIAMVVVLYILIYRKVKEMSRKRADLLGKKTPHGRENRANAQEEIPLTNGMMQGDEVHQWNKNEELECFAASPPMDNASITGNCDRDPMNREPQRKGIFQKTSSLSHMADRNSLIERGSQCTASSTAHANSNRDGAFQNLKIAAMLFVVALVYIFSFLPASLMANEVIELYLPIFYLYYVNNAANPIIYGFMNPTFRTEVVRIFWRRKSTVPSAAASRASRLH